MTRDGTRRHGKAREDMERHGKVQDGTERHEKSWGTRARNISYSVYCVLCQYAIPKINMLCDLMLFENEVKAAVR